MAKDFSFPGRSDDHHDADSGVFSYHNPCGSFKESIWRASAPFKARQEYFFLLGHSRRTRTTQGAISETILGRNNGQPVHNNRILAVFESPQTLLAIAYCRHITAVQRGDCLHRKQCHRSFHLRALLIVPVQRSHRYSRLGHCIFYEIRKKLTRIHHSITQISSPMQRIPSQKPSRRRY